ncbi:MAG: NAD-dependent protein deacylase, partial [Oscillospiraceae bacterium]|nr:NAD-dependent protein deacylase [Oscillospiraceae bacterium]
MINQENLQKLQNIIKNAKRLVFFGGAGVSTESGIPDFRSTDGLYHLKYDIPPELILSHSYFMEHPEKFFAFYRDKMLYLDAKPNPAHRKLAELEQAGILSAVVTQNIDGLHQLAGSQTVYELHGSIYRNYCLHCGKKYSAGFILKSKGIPRCDCGGIIKPDVVLYQESLPDGIADRAVRAISKADVLIIGGTSLNVYPAAGFLRYFHGAHLIILNRDVTQADSHAELCIRDN